MAAETLRIVRRRRGSLVASAAPTALTAASAPVTDPTQIFKGNVFGGRRENWQTEAWGFYRSVGELHYYVDWCGACCSKVRLVASEIDPDTGLPTGGIAEDNAEGRRVSEIVRGIAGGPQGQAQLMKRTAEVLTVAGELWHTILVRTEGQGARKRLVEKWYAVTRAQLERGTRGDTVLIKLPDGTKHEFNPAVDGMYRVWNEDAEDASLPDSPVRAVLDSLREIERTTRKIRNADDSRINNNGILVVPQEANLPPSQSPVSADKPGGGPAPAQRALAPQLQQMILDVQAEGIKNAGSPASLSPIVIAAPGDQIKNINHVTFGKDLTDMAIKTRNDGIARLATGLNVSPERLLGIGANSNHWSSRQISEEDVQLHIAPVEETGCQAIYNNVIRNVLIDEGIDPDKYTLWYDVSALTADPDKSDEAEKARQLGALRNEVYLRALGLPEDGGHDLTTLEGAQAWAREAIVQDPTLLADPAMQMLLGGELESIEWPEPVQPALPPGATDEVDPEDDPADEREPTTEDDAGQHGIGGAVSMATELYITRALELAGKRRVKTNDREQQARLRNVAAYDYHRFMEPASEAEVPRLIKDWDSGLDEFAARYGFDAEQVRSVVRSRARKQLTTAVVDA